MAKSKGKDTKDRDDSVPQGIARKTLRKAHFFLGKAMHSEWESDEAQEWYFDAALIFARTTLAHLRNEFGRKPGFKAWIELCERQPLIQELIDKRDISIHDQKRIIPSHEDAFYSEEVEKLSDQLREIESIINECERRYK